ncbi:MAG: Tex family protein [Bdellovibrionota bacterium]
MLAGMTLNTWLEKRGHRLEERSIQAVIQLAEGGATVPFIARYRKEQTGNLDEVAIRAVLETHEEFNEFVKRKEFIREQIKKVGKLDETLTRQLDLCQDASLLEDIYLPYKPKKKSKATAARDAGLEPLASWAWDTTQGLTAWEPGQTLLVWAYTYRNEKFGIDTAEKAIAGAKDILTEKISEDASLRQFVRETFFEKAFIRTKKAKKAAEHSKFESYFDFSETIKSLLNPSNSHRYMAIKRAWGEEEISLHMGAKLEAEDEAFFELLMNHYLAKCVLKADAPGAEIVKEAVSTALKAYVIPSIENEVHKELKRVADEAAIHVFSENVRKILLASPMGSKCVMGVDPGLRTGCKIAIVDDTGKFVADTVVHLNSTGEQEKATHTLEALVEKYNVRAVAVGNGTGGRETEAFLRKALKTRFSKIQVVVVSEAGASVYSASEVAREEFPKLDVTVRGAISIARRLQDPLAELIKVDPKSIGVGQYQHDVNQVRLKRKLDDVVDSCVNSVGVNLNTASYHLLSHVAGIGPSLAKSIVDHRTKGLFKSREDLKAVSRFSDKTFEQSAGFIRIAESDNPLDKTGVHPERYPILVEFASSKGLSVAGICGEGVKVLKDHAAELIEKFGEFTFNDIVAELEKPGRDPREDFVPFQFRDDIHAVSDLKKDMICPGIVTNVTNFGAFVDIGVHQDGLVHLSQIADRFIKDPREVVNPGDRVTVKVLDVDPNKKQISLSIRAALRNESSRNEGTHSRRPQYDNNRPKSGDGPRGPRPERSTSSRSDSRAPHRDSRGPRGPARPKFSNSPFEILCP